MINGTIDELIDTLYYGGEINLIYNNTRYMLESGYDNDVIKIYIFKYDEPDNSFYYEKSGTDAKKVIDDFLNLKIWNGKTFFEEAKNIEWTDF